MAMGLDAEAVCGCFRPLSRGSFFNKRTISCLCEWQFVFVPFLGDFFSIINHLRSIAEEQNVFIPFLGDLFFNRLTFSLYWMIRATCFRPLSRGLFSIRRRR